MTNAHPAPNRTDDSGPVLLFDGVCNLCHASVRWVIRRDRGEIFKFASLQSPSAVRLFDEMGLDPILKGANTSLTTLFLVDPVSRRVWSQSDAWIEILRRLDRPWSWLAVTGIFPKRLRDAVYGFIARNRYRWFGKKESCPLPDPSLKDRFI